MKEGQQKLWEGIPSPQRVLLAVLSRNLSCYPVKSIMYTKGFLRDKKHGRNNEGISVVSTLSI